MKRGTQSKLLKELEAQYGIKVSKVMISKLFKQQDYRLTFLKGGELDIDKTAKLLSETGLGEHSKKVKRKQNSKTVSVPLTQESKQPPESDQEEFDFSKPLTMKSPRSVIEKAKAFQQAEKERIKNEKDLKQLVNFNQTADIVFNFFRGFRDDLLEVSKRVAPMANMAKSKREAGKIIDSEITRIIKSKVGDDFAFDDTLKKKIIQILRAQLRRQ